jgi:hypothetical protein
MMLNFKVLELLSIAHCEKAAKRSGQIIRVALSLNTIVSELKRFR